jgi:hypothetical protein
MPKPSDLLQGTLDLVVLVQTMQGGIERSFLDPEQRGRGLRDVQGNAESGIGAGGERLEDQQLQRGVGILLTAIRGNGVAGLG